MRCVLIKYKKEFLLTFFLALLLCVESPCAAKIMSMEAAQMFASTLAPRSIWSKNQPYAEGEPSQNSLELTLVKRDLAHRFKQAFEPVESIAGREDWFLVYRHRKTGIRVIRKFNRIVESYVLESLRKFPLRNCAPILKVEKYDLENERGAYFELDLRPYGYKKFSLSTWGYLHTRNIRSRLLTKGLLANIYLLSEAGYIHGHLHYGNILINPDTGAIRITDYKLLQKTRSKAVALRSNLLNFIALNRIPHSHAKAFLKSMGLEKHWIFSSGSKKAMATYARNDISLALPKINDIALEIEQHLITVKKRNKMDELLDNIARSLRTLTIPNDGKTRQLFHGKESTIRSLTSFTQSRKQAMLFDIAL